MADSKEIALEANPLYGKIQETLSKYADRDPKWYEISNMLTAINDKGEFASVYGAYEAYFDKKGFVKNAERVPTHGMPKTPYITLEEVFVDYDEPDEYGNNMLHCTYVHTDMDGDTEVDEEVMEEAHSVYAPGEYVVLSFLFTKQQNTEKKQLLYALDNFYEELEKISEDDNLNERQIPIFSFALVPLLFGGKYSIHASNPFIWNLVENEDDDKDIYPEMVVVVFERSNITFFANDNADPAETFKKCRSELASEWLREAQQHQMEEEEKAYKAQREAEIAKLANRNVKHTFKTTKYNKNK